MSHGMPFVGAVSAYLKDEAPDWVCKRLRDADEDDILDESYPYRHEMDKDDYHDRMDALQVQLVPRDLAFLEWSAP